MLKCPFFGPFRGEKCACPLTAPRESGQSPRPVTSAQIAGGRVFTGRQALELGLVDELGGLDQAVEHVAEEAQLDDYEVRVLPKTKSFLDMLLSDLGAGDEEDDENTISLSLGSTAPRRSLSLFEAALPYMESVEPHRVEAVRSALRQLSLFNEERVILAMPVIQVLD